MNICWGRSWDHVLCSWEITVDKIKQPLPLWNFVKKSRKTFKNITKWLIDRWIYRYIDKKKRKMNEEGWWVKSPNLDGVGREASLKGTFQPCAQGWVCVSPVKGVGKNFKKRITKLLRHKIFLTKYSQKTHVFLFPFHIYIIYNIYSLDFFAVYELFIFMFKINKYIFCGLLQWLFKLLKYYLISLFLSFPQLPFCGIFFSERLLL